MDHDPRPYCTLICIPLDLPATGFSLPMVLFVPSLAPLCEEVCVGGGREPVVLSPRENSDIKVYNCGHRGEKKPKLQTDKGQPMAGDPAKGTSGNMGTV